MSEKKTPDSLILAKLLKETMNLMKTCSQKDMNGMGITATQGMVLRVLGQFGKMKVNELSKEMGLSNSTVSGILDRMEKIGHVERTRSLEDKRVVYVSLTGEFARLHETFHERADGLLQTILNQGTPEEAQKVIEGITIFRDLLYKHKNETQKGMGADA